MSKQKIDKDLELYRNLLETPTEFKNGFGWSTVFGILFCGLVMLPGAIYLGLMTGVGMGPAATWVTVILFAEISRRALQTMKKQQLVVLLYVAGVMVAGGPCGDLVYRAFLITSEAVRDSGMTNYFPHWWVPSPNSPAILDRNLLHIDWLIPISLMFFIVVIGKINAYTLGYFFFRVTSDVERLPFPLAPIQAQGAVALAEGTEATKEAAISGGDQGAIAAFMKKGTKKTSSSKWRLFSIGVFIGIAFGFLQIGVPALSGLMFGKPLFIIPQPFIDLTLLTQGILPATPTGLALDLGIIFIGFVLPFWAVIGTFCAICLTFVLNPILHNAGVLQQWQPGMDTVNTFFSNNVDFWLSFSIGIACAIAAVSVFSVIRDIRGKMAEAKEVRKTTFDKKHDMWSTPKGRGDYPLWLALIIYTCSGSAMIFVCHTLVPQLPLIFLIAFVFLYNPFISYINARLLGLSGQNVDIPFIREGSFILSGAKGIDIWLAPIPIENYGYMAQSFRVNELTGLNFFSLIKSDLIAVPVLFVLSLLFWAFIWKSNAIPSEMFPAAQINWELQVKNQTLYYSSTFVSKEDEQRGKSIMDSQFMKAIHPKTIGMGFASTILIFTLFSILGLPTLLVYGFMRGMGVVPHTMVLEIVGAMIGRFVLQKKFGTQNFLRLAPVLIAGYFTGVGLISMATIALKLIKEAVSSAPF